MIIVFYDGACGLCSKEINYYRRIAPSGVFDWQDVTQDTQALERAGISLVDALKHLHVADLDGRLHVGVDGFAQIWRHISYWKPLGMLVSLPIVRHIAGFAYNGFAEWRFARLDHCQVALKNADQQVTH